MRSMPCGPCAGKEDHPSCQQCDRREPGYVESLIVLFKPETQEQRDSLTTAIFPMASWTEALPNNPSRPWCCNHIPRLDEQIAGAQEQLDSLLAQREARTAALATQSEHTSTPKP